MIGIRMTRHRPQLPNIDVIITISDMWLFPYLINCCRSIREQNYPQERIEIIISLQYNKKENISQLALYCRDIEATLVLRKLEDPAFNRSKANNVGIRHGSREYVALLDCDTVFHPDTFRTAARFLKEKNFVIIPLGRMQQGTESKIFAIRNDKEWREVTKGRFLQRSAIGDVMVSRKQIEELRGLNEYLYGWGGEDTALEKRIRKAGIKVVNLLDHGFPVAMHQYHPPAPRDEFAKRNEEIISKRLNTIANPGSWGGIPND
jgi:GT2 family glycosyltransferase